MVHGVLRVYFYTTLISSVGMMCQRLPSTLVRCHGQHSQVASHRLSVQTVLVVLVSDFVPRTHVPLAVIHCAPVAAQCAIRLAVIA